MIGDLLTTRALNRATLSRQFLLERTTLAVPQVVEHLVGLQAQAPLAPYYALWSRVEGFDANDLARLLVDRGVVRIVVMRGTIHLVTASDALVLRAQVQPVLDRSLRATSPHTAGLEHLDLDAVAAAGCAVLEERPLAGKELRAALAQRFPGHDPITLAFAVRALLPLVQVPPRGLWGRSGQPVLTTAQTWLGRGLGTEPSLDDQVVRYLGAFGPAGVADVQTWSGLAGLREIIDRLRPRLRAFRDEQGRELLDLPDAPRPAPEALAPVRLVAEFDNLLLSHADRTRVLTAENRARVFAHGNGVIPGTVLVDGFVVGVWKLSRDRRGVAVVVTPYQRLAKRHISAVEHEARRLLASAAPEARTHAVQFASAG